GRTGTDFSVIHLGNRTNLHRRAGDKDLIGIIQGIHGKGFLLYGNPRFFGAFQDNGAGDSVEDQVVGGVGVQGVVFDDEDVGGTPFRDASVPEQDGLFAAPFQGLLLGQYRSQQIEAFNVAAKPTDILQ